MKRFIAGMAVLIVCIWSTAISQELRIGPTAGALFTHGMHGFESGMRGFESGERGFGSDMRGNGGGSSYSFGGEFVFSLDSIPLDIVGQVSYAPMRDRFGMRENLMAADGHGGRRGDASSLFSIGLGGRWVPLRGPVSPYLGVSFLLSHQSAQRFRPDSLQTPTVAPAPPGGPGERREFGEGGGATRFGVGLSAGSQFDLSSLIRLDVGASYSMNSPFRSGGNLSTIGFGASVLFRVF